MTRTRDFDEIRRERLKDPEFAAVYLEESLEAGDMSAFALALRYVAQAKEGGISEIAKNAELDRTQLYRTLSKKGNPQLSTLTKVLHSLGLRIAIMPEVHA